MHARRIAKEAHMPVRQRFSDPPRSPRLPHSSRRSRSRALAAVVSLLALALPVAAPAGASKKMDRRRALHEEINDRWEGADCTLRLPLEFKKKKPDHGWYESRFYVTDKAMKIKRLTFRLKLRSLEPLRAQMASRHLVAGTRFRCEGWFFRDDNGKDNAYLALRTVTGDVEGEMFFWAGSNHPELKQLESVEQYVRLEVFDVRAAEERLASVPLQAAPPAAGSFAAQRTAPAAGGVYAPRLELLGVSVEPAAVRAGGSIELVAHYSVAGLPPGAAFQAVETRRLLQGERELASSSEEVARGNGGFHSSREAPIPASAEPGIYRVEIVVELAGQEAAGTALFEVQR